MGQGDCHYRTIEFLITVCSRGGKGISAASTDQEDLGYDLRRAGSGHVCSMYGPVYLSLRTTGHLSCRPESSGLFYSIVIADQVTFTLPPGLVRPVLFHGQLQDHMWKSGDPSQISISTLQMLLSRTMRFPLTRKS
jgi:hypothetical protein